MGFFLEEKKDVENPIQTLRRYRMGLHELRAAQEKIILEKTAKIAVEKGLPENHFVENKEEILNFVFSEKRKIDDIKTATVPAFGIAALACAGVIGSFIAGNVIGGPQGIDVIYYGGVGSFLAGSLLGLGYYSIIKSKGVNKIFNKKQKELFELEEAYKVFESAGESLNGSFVENAREKGYSEKEIIGSLVDQDEQTI